ncbi:hypothetical protein ANAPRD1_01132 [Anaplasma phagocytophilum]|nr:hypothetical protein ANAPRD1_01132 [Anaplasma phagocytophilum]
MWSYPRDNMLGKHAPKVSVINDRSDIANHLPNNGVAVCPCVIFEALDFFRFRMPFR